MFSINWRCKQSWKKSSKNTLWCLFGCSIGDFGTIAFFQFSGISWPTISIMLLAIINGLVSSILLETIVLTQQMTFRNAFKTAIGMSLISMIAKEIATKASPSEKTNEQHLFLKKKILLVQLLVVSLKR